VALLSFELCRQTAAAAAAEAASPLHPSYP